MLLPLVLLVVPLALCQNPYGPSQLDQYARLINSGNLGGFGWLNSALQKGTIRGFADLSNAPRLQGLPPLPLTPEEVVYQLTSTAPPPPTRATARPTPPPTPPPPMTGIYAINPIPEMPPMPEERLHGTYNDDGEFVPDHDSTEENNLVRRNQIQGTKIRDISRDSRTSDELQERSESVDHDLLRVTTAERRLAQKLRSPDSPNVRVHRQSRQPYRNQVEQQDVSSRRVFPRQSAVPRQQNQYPQFMYQPKPAAVGRDPAVNNLLTEVEEYDDFLDQRNSYLERFPGATVGNPYNSLPPGKLPTLQSIRDFFPSAPARTSDFVRNEVPHPTAPPPTNHFMQPQTVWNQHHHNMPDPFHLHHHQPPPHMPHANPNPFSNFFNLFRIPHAHALGAATHTIEQEEHSAEQRESQPQNNMMMPSPTMGLVDIHQRPLIMPRMPNMLNIPLVFGK